MALSTSPSFFLQVSHSSTNTSQTVPKINRPLNCLPSSVTYKPVVSRRRANYKPNIWDHDLIQSLRSDYQDEAYAKRPEKLKEEVQYCMLQEAVNPLTQLELIDAIQCFGLSHIFDNEIKDALDNKWDSHNNNENKGGLENNSDLFATSLLFGCSENMGIMYHKDEAYAKRAEKLKEEVKHYLLQEAVNPLAQLELIDAIQRLGVGHIFDKEIKEALNIIWDGHNKNDSKGVLEDNYDLYATSLLFRLLREHGYHVSQDVFNKFKDERGGLITSVSDDINGILTLYEASHLAHQGETLLLEWKTFTRTHLKAIKESVDIILANKLGHALELPMHWRTQRLEALWYLNKYENEENMNPILLELAKLDFNMVQATHQMDLRKASSWWSSLGLGGKLSFSRDRMKECFFVALGVMFEPQFGYPRVELAKVCQLITTIDDIYDVFGSLDELECFTDAVDRWDIKSIDRLPEYMKICFIALYNTINEMGYEILKDQGINIIPHLHRVWADFCKAMLVESKWYYSGYKPSLEEYLNNAWVSSSGPVILVHALLLSKQTISTQVLDGLDKSPDLIRWPSMIFRLCNDLGTYEDEKVRGDAPSSIDCYMKEANVSEMDARNHIEDLVFDAWKKLNGELSSTSPYPIHFINSAFNLARVVHCIYQHGDGHTVQDRSTIDRLTSLLVQPIPLVRG